MHQLLGYERLINFGAREGEEAFRAHHRMRTLPSTQGNGSGAGAADFAYDVDNLNQRRKITLADGSYWLYNYDEKGQVTSGRKYFSDGRVMAGQHCLRGSGSIV